MPLVHRSVLATGLASPAAQVGKGYPPSIGRVIGVKKNSIIWYDSTLHLTAVCEEGKSLVTYFFFFLFNPFFLHSTLITF